MSEKVPSESVDQSPDPPALELPVPHPGHVGAEQTEPQQQFGAPRRFGIGTILILMAAASLLLALLIARGIPAWVVLHVVGFTTLIGFAQSIMFKGSNPRLASIMAGLVICPVYVICFIIFLVATDSSHRLNESNLSCATIGVFIFGPGLGYLAGGIVGGIFLLMDRWEKKFGRREESKKVFDPFDPNPIDAEVLAEDEVE